jgi:hypothetical protein
MADLYLIQNEFGLFKIGRSISPASRLHQIRTVDRCKVATIKLLVNCGHLEEQVHIRLCRFRLTGEWFDGTKTAETAMSKIFALQPSTTLPFSYDPKNAAAWLKELEIARDRAARIKNHNRFIASIPHYRGPSRMLDLLVWRQTHGEDGRILHACADGEFRTIFPDETLETGELIPNYSADVEKALSIWPGQFRPAKWDGDPLSCIIGGLRAQRMVWQNEPQTWSKKPRFAGPKWNVPSAARDRLLAKLVEPR